MAIKFYDHTTYPQAGSSGSSAALRSELDLIEAGFDQVGVEIDSITAQLNFTAGNISFTPVGNVISTNLQEAVAELDSEKAGLAINNNFTGTNTFNNLVATGGSINGVTVGESSRSSGKFTTLSANGAFDGTTGAFSGSLSSVGYSGTTGSFTGALSSSGYTGTSGTFSGTLASSGYSGTTGSFSGSLSSVGYSGTSGTFSANLTVLGIGDFTGTSYLGVPSGSTAQRGTPSRPSIRYNQTLTQFEGFNGTTWGTIGGGATGGGADRVFNLNSQTVTQSYTIPAGQNANTTSPLTIADGVTISVADGSNLVIL